MAMMNVPLTPKDPERGLFVIMLGRISTVHQDEGNIEASYRYVRDYLNGIYAGKTDIRALGERASGMLPDRASIREAEDLLATGNVDLVIAEDLSRIFRNPRYQYVFVQDAVDAGTRVICIADQLDTADDNWETMLGAATLRHGLVIPDTRRRVRRKAVDSFLAGGMVMKLPFGYRKLTKEEAASSGVTLRMCKVPDCTAIIQEMRQRV